MRVLRDQYIQEWDRGRGAEGERKRESVQTAYLEKVVESHRLPPHFPLEPPDKQCSIEMCQQQYQRELSTRITQQICQQQR